jgi:hypothetical protein
MAPNYRHVKSVEKTPDDLKASLTDLTPAATSEHKMLAVGSVLRPGDNPAPILFRVSRQI